jgi:hypothetical protein
VFQFLIFVSSGDYTEYLVFRDKVYDLHEGVMNDDMKEYGEERERKGFMTVVG